MIHPPLTSGRRTYRAALARRARILLAVADPVTMEELEREYILAVKR
ncbi:hypothetical protein [Archangium violaceum]